MDKLLGLLFGHALGDAVGRYTEFMYENMLKKRYPNSSDFLFHPKRKILFKEIFPNVIGQMILIK